MLAATTMIPLELRAEPSPVDIRCRALGSDAETRMSGVNGRSAAGTKPSVHTRDCCDTHIGRSGFVRLALRAATSAPTCG